MSRRSGAGAGRAAYRRLRRRLTPSRTSSRALLIVGLLLAVFLALRTNEDPGFAVAMYALVPILLAVTWFELLGGLLAATAAVLLFLLDVLLPPSSAMGGSGLVLATFNRAAVFYGVAVLVTLLLRRERGLTLRLREQETELAELESLRAALIPSAVPARPGLQLATAFVPADGELAGDFFLVAEGPLDSTTIVVGDVVGHGLEAARVAAFARAALATFARFSSDPVQLMQLANTALLERGEGDSHFVTVICVNVGDPGPDRAVRWAAAGHATPWDLDTGDPLPGGRVAAPLGVQAELSGVEGGCTALAPGAGVLLFTDGLTEGRSAQRRRRGRLELFGEEQARAVVRQQAGAPPGQILDALVSAVTDFAGGALADDLCLVAVRVQDAPDAPTPR